MDRPLRKNPAGAPASGEPPGPTTGRLAPSPTGLLHVGHARSFLLAWWHARAQGGRVVLRIEDLDRERSRQEMIDATRRDLEWLGLDWDAERLQSAGLDRLQAALGELERNGRAYACVCSRADVRAAQTAPHRGETEIPYPGTCRGRFGDRAEARRKTGRSAGLRLLVRPGSVAVDDLCAGQRSFDPSREVGDFLVARRDGAPAYQLAVVVDDAADGVSEVVRGDDLLPSTARQILVAEALELRSPSWMHVPLVQGDDGRRLAKRADGLALAELRAEGRDPRGLVAWAARSAGQEAPRRARPAELVADFDPARIPRVPVRFGRRERAALPRSVPPR